MRVFVLLVLHEDDVGLSALRFFAKGSCKIHMFGALVPFARGWPAARPRVLKAPAPEVGVLLR